MSQVLLLLSRPRGGVLTKLGQLVIKIAGRSAMTHCAIQIGNNVYESTTHGCLPPLRFADWLDRQSAAKFANLNLIDTQSAIQRAVDLTGMGYDMGANLSQVINNGDLASDCLINCVEHVNEVLAAGGARIFHKRAASGRSPGDIEALAQFDWVSLK